MRSMPPALRLVCLALACLVAAIAPAGAVTQTPSPAPPALQIVLAEHMRARAALHVRHPRTLYMQGSVAGFGLDGSFENWREGDRERYDEVLGIRAQRTLRIGSVEGVRNANGDRREPRGGLG